MTSKQWYTTVAVIYMFCCIIKLYVYELGILVIYPVHDCLTSFIMVSSRPEDVPWSMLTGMV